MKLMKTKLINPWVFILSVVSITLSIVLSGKMEQAKLLISISLVLFQMYYFLNVIVGLCGVMILMPHVLLEGEAELEKCVKNILYLMVCSFVSAMFSFFIYAYFKFFIFKI